MIYYKMLMLTFGLTLATVSGVRGGRRQSVSFLQGNTPGETAALPERGTPGRIQNVAFKEKFLCMFPGCKQPAGFSISFPQSPNTIYKYCGEVSHQIAIGNSGIPARDWPSILEKVTYTRTTKNGKKYWVKPKTMPRVKCMYPACEALAAVLTSTNGAIYPRCKLSQHNLTFTKLVDGVVSGIPQNEFWPREYRRKSYSHIVLNGKAHWLRPSGIDLMCLYPGCPRSAKAAHEKQFDGARYRSCSEAHGIPVIDKNGVALENDWPLPYKKVKYQKLVRSAEKSIFWAQKTVPFPLCMYPGCEQKATYEKVTKGTTTVYLHCNNAFHKKVTIDQKGHPHNCKKVHFLYTKYVLPYYYEYEFSERCRKKEFWVRPTNIAKLVRGQRKPLKLEPKASRRVAIGTMSSTQRNSRLAEKGSLADLKNRRANKNKASGTHIRRRLNRTERIMNYLQHL